MAVPVPQTDHVAAATPFTADPVAAPANDPPPASDDAINRQQAVGEVSEVAAGAQAGTSSHMSYDPEPVGNNPYFDSAGRKLAMLVVPDGETVVISCGNGNIPDSSKLWATADNVLVYDGARRLMDCYNYTIGPLGVWRLRVEAELEAPAGFVVVFWAPYYDLQAPDESLFVAIDPLGQAFYPIVHLDFCRSQGGLKHDSSD
ncbi:hypothetical protein CTA2_6018 [Colletotrichum tanaceti]|uniref:Uncharacterized protein n=1 Tax=Colletotrichum tanaceti TaxID=1306861 RepID=A0A4U6XIS8_9PEZI|nr:hypothetical protein CTA2_6018 [Colletotrichum tanaceti]TKW55888.1 hypothetical protein CTA1_11739 [Colletotrichum tanaceti]